ncbi:MAG: hypothetical protein HFH10_09675 [Dorea sp.]|nr:hypothetical protein [Dorea sp.]
MAINGVNSYMGYYNYQASINNFRLSQALANNQRFTQAMSSVSGSSSNSYRNTSLTSSMAFVKNYSSSMSDLMGSANALRSANQSGVMNDYVVSSSDASVAKATEKLTVRNAQQMDFDVQQLAAAQVNVSEGVKASDKASSDMDFTVGNALNSVNVKVSAVNSDGSAKTNADMLKEAADQINRGTSNVKASVVQKDGVASLQLEGKYTGVANSFEVTGNLGAAAGADTVKTEAANSKYSVTVGGKTTQHESYSNDVYADSYRIGVELKGVGKTTIKADVDSDKIATALSDLVGSYNSSLKLLNDNYDRGTGVDKQLRNLVAGLGSEQSLKQLGITVNKDATLSFDKDAFAKNMKENPSLTRSLISGPGGIADRAFSKGSTGMNVSSSSLINGDLASAQEASITNPMNAFSSYSRSGAYAMNNYAAVGMMLNYLI